MNVLPIIDRELRIAARKPATYWGRIWSPLSLLLVLTITVMEVGFSGRNASAVGEYLFMGLTWFCFLFTLFSGVALVADTLSEERREGTLGLLFLTNLKEHDIVIGKLSPGALQGIYSLFSVIPVLVVPLLIGGVTLVEVGRVVLALVNTLWLSLTVCLLVSSITRQQRSSVGASLLALLGISMGLPFFGGALFSYLTEVRGMRLAPEFLAPFFLPSPACATVLSFETVRASGVGGWGVAGYWVSLAAVHALGWLSLLIAVVVVRNTWQDRPKTVRQIRFWARLKEWFQGVARVRAAHRRNLLDLNAIHWLTCRTRLKPYYVPGIMLVVVGAWVGGALEWRREWFSAPIAVGFALVTNALIKLGLAGESGKQIGDDARTGALELMLSTKLTVREILRGQFLTLRRMFGWSAVFTLAFQLFLVATSLQWSTDFLSDRERLELVLACGASLIALLPDMVAVSWVAFWVSLSSKKPGQAGPLAGYLVLGLPWGVMIGGFAAIGYLCFRLGIRFNPPNWVMIFTWLVLGLMTDVVMMLWAKNNLLLHFRTVAARRYLAEPPVSLFARLGRMFRRKRITAPKVALANL